MDTNILTTLLIEFKNKIEPATGMVLPYAKNTLWILAVIDLVVVYIMALIKDEETGYKPLLVNIIKYGAFAYLVLSYNSIATMIMESFAFIGLKAGGNLLSYADLSNPSKIAFLGLTLTKQVWQNVTISDLYNPFASIMILISIIAINIAFFVVGLQIFITTIEFGIISALGLILVPFGVFRPTAFIFDKIREGIINFGIKYMILSFVVSISISLMSKWTPLVAQAKFEDSLVMAFGACALAYLCYHAPNIAGSMSSSSGGSLVGAAMVGAIAGTAGSIKRGGENTVETAKQGAKAAKKMVQGSAGLAKSAYDALTPRSPSFDDTTSSKSEAPQATSDSNSRGLSGVQLQPSPAQAAQATQQQGLSTPMDGRGSGGTAARQAAAIDRSVSGSLNNQSNYTDTAESAAPAQATPPPLPQSFGGQNTSSQQQRQLSGVDLSGSGSGNDQQQPRTFSPQQQQQQPQQINRHDNKTAVEATKQTVKNNYERGVDGYK